MDWPENGILEIKSLGSNLRLFNGKIKFIELLGSNEPLEWHLDETSLKVRLPKERPCEYAYVLKIVSE